MTVATQAWVSSHEPKPELIRPLDPEIAAMPVHQAKPRCRGGLWTSTHDPRYGSDWIQWCLSEEFHCDRSDPTFNIWTLEPDPAARVYEIDSYADLERLAARYGARSAFFGEDYPDWLRVAEAFDAVHLTERGQVVTHLSQPLNLYGWDCESTVWFRWAFTSVRDLGAVRCEVREWCWDEEVSSGI